MKRNLWINLHELLSQDILENGLTLQQKHNYALDVAEGKSNGKRLYERGYKHDPARSGMTLYLDAVHDPAYAWLFSQQERDLFLQLAPYIADELRKSRVKKLVHLGPWNGEKWVDYLMQLPEKVRQDLADKTYVPVDISPQATKLASERMEDAFDMKSDPIIGDWLKTEQIRLLKQKFLLFEWGSFDNFSVYEAGQLLDNLGIGTGFSKDMLLMSFFLAPERNAPDYREQVQRLEEAYRTEAVKRRIMSGLQELGYDIEKLEFVAEYTDELLYEGVAAMRVGARVKMGEEISLKIGNLDLRLSGGQALWAITSRRYTKEKITSMYKQHGWSLKASALGTDVGWLALQNRSWVQDTLIKNKRKIKRAIVTALLAGGALGAYKWVENYTHQQKIHEKILHNIQFKNADRYQDRFVTEYDTPEKKLERVKWLANEMVKVLHIRYRDFAFPDDNELQNTLGLLISQGNNLDVFLRGDGEYEAMVHFLDEVFRPLYSTTSSDIEQAELYAHLKEYEGEMRETRESQDDHQINENTLPSGSIPKIWVENRYQKLKKLGKYITSDGQKYDIAIGERRQATWYNDYRVEWKKLVARMMRDDESANDDTPYRVIDGKKIVQDYFKKWYTDKLTHDLLLLVANEREKQRMKSDRTLYRYSSHEYELRELWEVLNGLLVRLNMQGYDFSYLTETWSEEMQKRFLFAFLPLYEGLMKQEKEILNQHHISPEQSETVSLSQMTTRLTDYLDTYFYAIDAQQDLFGLKKELVREMLQRADNDWRYEQIKDDASCFDYLYARKELCMKFGYKLQTWQDFGDYEPALRQLLLDKTKDLGNEFALPGQLNYFNNFYRCTDGRVFSFGGNYHEMHAFEITPATSHRAIKQCLPEIAQGIENQRGKWIWSIQGSSRWDLLKNQQAVSYINQHYLPFTQETAKVVAQDYFNQKYGEKIAERLSAYLLETCGSTKKELQGAVKKLLSQTIVKLLLSYTLSFSEITAAENSNEYRTTLLYYFLIPECKDALEKIMGMSIEWELPYAVTDQLKFVPTTVQEFMQTFGVMHNWMINAENGALITPEKNMHEFTEEQRKVAQALLKIVSSLPSEKYDLKTHLGRYTFFMEHAQDFKSLGYAYHDRYFSYFQADINKIISWKSKESTIESLGSDYSRGVYYIVTPQGKYRMARAVDRAWWSSPIYARPIFSKQERNDIIRDLKKEFALKYGGGYISTAESQRVQSTFEERYVMRSTSHAKKLFDELYAVYGEALFEQDPADREGTAF